MIKLFDDFIIRSITSEINTTYCSQNYSSAYARTFNKILLCEASITPKVQLSANTNYVMLTLKNIKIAVTFYGIIGSRYDTLSGIAFLGESQSDSNDCICNCFCSKVVTTSVPIVFTNISITK